MTWDTDLPDSLSSACMEAFPLDDAITETDWVAVPKMRTPASDVVYCHVAGFVRTSLLALSNAETDIVVSSPRRMLETFEAMTT